MPGREIQTFRQFSLTRFELAWVVVGVNTNELQGEVNHG